MCRFITAIADGQRDDKIELATAQHVFSSVLRVFTRRIQFVHFRTERGGVKHDPIPVKAEDILQLIRQCVSLELKHHMGMLLDRLDTLSRTGQSATTFEGFFLPLLKELDEMPPGRMPGTISEEFHFMAHQLAEKLWKQHALHFLGPFVAIGCRRRNLSTKLQ